MSQREIDRFWSKVVQNGTCWEFQSGSNGKGYKLFTREGRYGGKQQAHRYSYEYMVGTIPEGLELDHLCKNKTCVNPDHLDPVTHQVNMSRVHNTWSQKSHCPQEHEYSGDNLYIDRGGWRGCVQCRRDRSREWQRNKRKGAQNV